MNEIKDKVKLDKINYSVRAAQAVLQYGVGAMVDFADQTLVTAAPETWSNTKRIYDERFAKALGVDYFVLPRSVSYSRFPEWYFCPKCREFKKIDEWTEQWKKMAQNNKKMRNKLDNDNYLVRNMQCPKCFQDLVVSRIVTVCEKGHLNDFPWKEWVHKKAKRECNQLNPILKFKTGASGTEGLEGLSIECSCGARTTLSGAFDTDAFEKMEDTIFRCKGNHPFNHTIEKCNKYPRTIQRGASSVYFPVIYTSLVIPPYAEKINSIIENSKAFEECCVIINDEEPDERIEKIQKKLKKWSEKIALEIGKTQVEVEKVLRRKWLSEAEKVDVTSIKYKIEEYEALSGEVSINNSGVDEFSREEMDIKLYDIEHIKSISLIDKVRVVKALTGFSRLNPVSSMEDEGFVNIKEERTNYYPANEVRGEAIFIEIDSGDVKEWINKNPKVLSRAKKLNDNYNESYFGVNNKRNITPKFILLHTLAHLLISQLSFECGYNVASISEKIYCSEEEDGKEMSGIFIYTASGDSEGTLGGLVRQGRNDAFPDIFKKAINNAKTCSNDPICITSNGQGRDSLNLAACYSCALLPETSCEENNVFLDRGMVIGTFEDEKMGFWSSLDKYELLNKSH